LGAGPSAALAAGPVAGLLTGISGSLFAAGKREQAGVGFEGFVGAKNAKTLTKDLTDFAKNTPLTIGGIRDMATEVLAMGGSMKSVLPTLKKIGDATGGNMDRMSRALFNYMEVINKEAADKVDMKQFVRAGIPIYQQLAKQLKVTRAEIGKMVSDGKISGKVISEAFTQMTSKGGMFENRMFKMSRTFLGRLSNFKDASVSFAENFGQLFLPMATTGLRQLSAFSDGLSNLVSKMGDLKQLGPTIKLIAGVMFAAFNPLVTLFAAIFLVIDDLVAYSQKRKSVTGYLMKEINILQKAEDLRKKTVDSLQESTAGGWYLNLLQRLKESVAIPENFGPTFMQKNVEPSPGGAGAVSTTINSNTQIGLKEGVSAEDALRMQNKASEEQARLIHQRVRKTRSN
jgi:tape measure domain-containing protein